MRVHIEWLDGTTRVYEPVRRAEMTRDGAVLNLYGDPVYGLTQHIASVPLAQVREYRREGD